VTDCRIYRRQFGMRSWNPTTGVVRTHREWCAECPHCPEIIRWHGSWSTRKNVKDALHRHVKEKHS
jgi:hypothetical protein